jgi:RNA polymerase sigma-70 factor, ECF subfamily
VQNGKGPWPKEEDSMPAQQRRKKLTQQICDMHPQLYRAAYAWSHNSALAEDLVQEATIKALTRVDTLQDTDALKTWVFRIMTNCYRDWHRAHREHLDLDDLEVPCDESPEIQAEQDRVIHQVRCAMAQLSPDHRQVIALIDIEGFTYREAGETLEIPIGTVMSRLNRGRQHLRSLLALERPTVRNEGAPATSRPERSPGAARQTNGDVDRPAPPAAFRSTLALMI